MHLKASELATALVVQIRSFASLALPRRLRYSTSPAGPWSCMESGFIEWLKVERDLAPQYVSTLRRCGQALDRAGVDFSTFTTGERARLAVRPYLARKKDLGQLNAMKLAQKLLNHYAAYHGLRDRDGQPTHWDLARVPRRRLDPYTAAEVQAILASIQSGFKGLRKGAMLYLLAHTGLRKGEVWSLCVEDFDQDRGAVLLRQPRKRGEPRWVNLPDTAWEPTSRLYRYLVARAKVAGDTGLLWTTAKGWDLTLGGFSSDLYEIRSRSGVPLNFNRWRHSRGTVAHALGVGTRVQQEEWGHGDERSTGHYMHSSQSSRRQLLAEAGLPGYKPRDRDRELVDALALV